MQKLDEGDAGERRAEAGGEFGYAEELVKEGGDPEGERRLLEPEAGVPVGDEPASAEHLAGDLGVDAFVPIREAVVAKEGEDGEGGEEDGEGGGGDGLAEGEVLWVARRLRFRGHENSVRDAARTASAARTARVALVPRHGWGEGVRGDRLSG